MRIGIFMKQGGGGQYDSNLNENPWFQPLCTPPPRVMDAVLQKRLAWALFAGVMGCGAAEATGLGFVCFVYNLP